MPATVAGRGRGSARRALPRRSHPAASAIADAPDRRLAVRRRGRLAGSRRGRLERLSRRAARRPHPSPLPQGATTGGATKTSGGVTNDVEPVGADNDLSSRADTGASAPLILSGVLLLAGLGLFLLRWAARRSGR